jgi:hypothetical protein
VVDIVGPGAKLVRYDGIERFDVLPLLVATEGGEITVGDEVEQVRGRVCRAG